VPIQKWLFSPISVLGGNFNPRNINHMPAVKISARLKLDENISFLDGHEHMAQLTWAQARINAFGPASSQVMIALSNTP
jgi:hypothetical protein